MARAKIRARKPSASRRKMPKAALPAPSLAARIDLPLILSVPKDDGDMMHLSVFRKLQGVRNIGQRSYVEDRLRSASHDEASFYGRSRGAPLTPCQIAAKNKRRLHATPSAQQ
ncbi:MAG: hypothetical protein ACREDD_07720 [Methylocella sp.]